MRLCDPALPLHSTYHTMNEVTLMGTAASQIPMKAKRQIRKISGDNRDTELERQNSNSRERIFAMCLSLHSAAAET